MDIYKFLELIKDPDLKIKISELVSENLQLKEESFKLKKQLEKDKEEKNIQSKLIFENNHYYINESNRKDGPFCTNCWDDKKKMQRLHQGSPHNGLTNFTCPNCKTLTSTGRYIQPQERGRNLY